MKRIMLFLAVVLLTGCASLPETGSVPPLAGKVTLGMTRPEVVAIMDTMVTVGFEIDPLTGADKPVEAKNLYSTEILSLAASVYQVDRYIVRSVNGLASIAEADLFPVVYRNNILVAKGQDGVKALKDKEHEK